MWEEAHPHFLFLGTLCQLFPGACRQAQRQHFGATQLFACSQASPGTPLCWVLPDPLAWLQEALSRDPPLLRTSRAGVSCGSCFQCPPSSR